ncbi:hypothetical protein ONZ45_g16462 [Pleurotus djamor]|nr:hypothetical protein ONZ45_g16462 [Pleurotus djamor]
MRTDSNTSKRQRTDHDSSPRKRARTTYDQLLQECSSLQEDLCAVRAERDRFKDALTHQVAVANASVSRLETRLVQILDKTTEKFDKFAAEKDNEAHNLKEATRKDIQAAKEAGENVIFSFRREKEAVISALQAANQSKTLEIEEKDVELQKLKSQSEEKIQELGAKDVALATANEEIEKLRKRVTYLATTEEDIRSKFELLTEEAKTSARQLADWERESKQALFAEHQRTLAALQSAANIELERDSHQSETRLLRQQLLETKQEYQLSQYSLKEDYNDLKTDRERILQRVNDLLLSNARSETELANMKCSYEERRHQLELEVIQLQSQVAQLRDQLNNSARGYSVNNNLLEDPAHDSLVDYAVILKPLVEDERNASGSRTLPESQALIPGHSSALITQADADKMQQVSKKGAASTRRTAMTKEVRDAFATLLGFTEKSTSAEKLEALKSRSATAKQVEDWELLKQLPPLGEMVLLLNDVNHKFNTAISLEFSKAFQTERPKCQYPTKDIQECFMRYFKYLASRINLPIEKARTIRNRQSQRWNTRRNTRMETAQELTKRDPRLAGVVVLLNALGKYGNSSDESDVDDSDQRIYAVRGKPWRSPEVTSVLIAIDERRGRNNQHGNCKSGAQPHPRIREMGPQSDREAVLGLPRNYYARSYLEQINAFTLSNLAPIEEVDLSEYVPRIQSLSIGTKSDTHTPS